MKILQAIYQFRTGGGALQVVADLTAAARNSGHSVTILARDISVATSVGAERFFTGNKALDWWHLWQRLRTEQYDIIHVHDRYCSLLINLISQAPPSVQTNHIAYRTHRRLTPFADIVVGCSRSMDQHHADFFQLPSSRRALIPNGVFPRNPKLERVQSLRQNLPSAISDCAKRSGKANRRVCLTVARLAAQKGHTYLLEAIASLPPSLRQSWCFVLAGGGELELQLRTQAEKLGILQDVLFLGHTADVAEWLALADAFVLPSLYEGLPLALLEAMAVGLPCLATAVDGNLEVLRHEENGLLCMPANSQGLGDALETLLSDTTLRNRLGKQAQTDYWSQWTFERTWQQYEALYRQLYQREVPRLSGHSSELAK
jgi:glycosyltransferase involved in cell wall biosynthesis